MVAKATVILALSAVLVGLIAEAARAAPPAVVGGFTGFRARALDFDVRGDLGCLVTKRVRRGPELSVLSLQDPASPTVLGTLDLPGHLNRVVLGNDLAYIATSLNEREVLVVDVADPQAPQVIGEYDTLAKRDAISLAVAGSVLFVGTKRSHGHELHVVDVSNPAAPVGLASLELGTDVNDLAVDGDVLYAATRDNDKELIAFDVSVPAAISELSSIDLPGSADAQGVDVHRGLIYVVRRTRRENFFVLDASNLSQISATRLDGRGEKVRIYRDRAYVAARGREGLQVVDVGDPNQPHVLYRIGDASATSVHVDAAHAYLTGRRKRDGLLIVDTESQMRPNVVVIYTDDQHGSSVDFMPTVQELASRGLTFRQSFVTTPLCGPSRASLLTGLYTHNHGAILNVSYIGAGPGAIGSDQSTVATWLQSAGYRTGFFGKYLNGFGHLCTEGICNVPPGWDDWQANAAGGIGSIYYNYGISNNGVLETYGDQPDDYSTDVLAQKAVDFVERQDNRPFFAILSVNAPHLNSFVSLPPAPRHIGAFAGVPPWRPPSYDEEDVSDKPSFFADKPRAADSFLTFSTYGAWLDKHRQQQLEALLSVDEAVGEILETLERIGEDQDTVVIFTSDNGYFWGEHRLWSGKGGPHEESIRVPLIVSYPRLIEPGGEDQTHMVLNIDLAPTIAALADTIPDGPVDGQSFVPLLKGEPAPGWRSDFLIEVYGNFSGAGEGVYQGFRDASVAYAYYPNSAEDELYDLVDDPDEMESQASNPLYDTVRSYSQNRINQLMTNDALRIDF